MIFELCPLSSWMKREQSLILLEEIKNINEDFDLEIDGSVVSPAFMPGR